MAISETQQIGMEKSQFRAYKLTQMNLRNWKRTMGLVLLCGAGAALAGAEAEPPGEARFLTNIRQLTFEGKRSGEGYFSSDGKGLIFQSEREAENPFYQIYFLDLISGESHRVSPGLGKTTCAFFRPGSDEVLFSSTHLDPAAKAKQQAESDFRATGKERRYSWDYDEQMDIFSARRDGTHLKRLTDARGYDAEGSYSPDGKKIVFCSLRDTYPTNKLSAQELKHFQADPSYFGEIYIMNANGTGQKRLTASPGYDGGPFFSPDGQHIIWRHFDETGTQADIYTMALDGSDPRQLTHFGAMSWAPYYHPSGKYVIFTSNKLGFSNFELYLVDAAGEHEPLRVTYTEGFDGLPVFSPEGRRLCWTSSRTSDGKSQLFLADWDDQAAQSSIRTAPVVHVAGPINSSSHSASESSAMPGRSSRPSAEITAENLRSEVNYLASERLDGRMTGTKGAQLAADYIVGQLRQAGLEPLAQSRDYFQPFQFNSGVRVVTNQNHLMVLPTGGVPVLFEVEKDLRPLSFTANGEVSGEVLFAGYGLFVPGKGGEGYDSYAGLDATNKIVLVLRYVPEEVAPKRRQELNRYAGLRYKAMLARERGAKAVLFVTGPNSPNAGELAGLSFDSSLAGSGIVGVSISSNVASAILSGAGQDLKQIQSDLDRENPHAGGGFAISNVQVRVSATVEHLKKTDRNVLAVLPPPKGRTEFVMVGAHYDHLGHGESGGMQRQGEEGQIHYGADDNASGTAVVLELAAVLASEKARNPNAFERGLIFAFWSGEELGLIGSSFFVEHPVGRLSNIVAYVNFDMVGRLSENKLLLQGVGSSPTWRRLAEKRNVAAGFNLVLQDDPYLPTDVTAFYPKEIPVLSFFTGSHDDYHRPTDTAGKINYEGMQRIAQFARGLLDDLAKKSDRPAYAKVEQSNAGAGTRENLRAYLGTIPDYAAEVAGVKLSGMRGGSPAEKAGLKGGDIIIGLGGQKIANIYDYTYALDAARIGQPVALEIMRAGQHLTLRITPEARK